MNDGILIVGARGLIGSRLARMAEEHGEPWRGTSSHLSGNMLKLDLRDDADIEQLTARPRIAYLLAAETNLRRCEENPAATHHLNVEQTAKLARRLHAAGSALVFVSTNLVFDGSRPSMTPEDACCPVTEYGRQKAELEALLRAELPRTAIVRLTKVVHPDFPLFRDWHAALAQSEIIRPFSDMMFCPVDLALVTKELWELSRSFRPGTFQLSGDADVSYADAARLLAATCGFSPALVQPQTTTAASFTSPFPRHTQLALRPVSSGNRAASATETLRAIFTGMKA